MHKQAYEASVMRVLEKRANEPTQGRVVYNPNAGKPIKKGPVTLNPGTVQVDVPKDVEDKVNKGIGIAQKALKDGVSVEHGGGTVKTPVGNIKVKPGAVSAKVPQKVQDTVNTKVNQVKNKLNSWGISFE
jgi:hypothetical protein